jgi:hypothetical protein
MPVHQHCTRVWSRRGSPKFFFWCTCCHQVPFELLILVRFAQVFIGTIMLGFLAGTRGRAELDQWQSPGALIVILTIYAGHANYAHRRPGASKRDCQDWRHKAKRDTFYLFYGKKKPQMAASEATILGARSSQFIFTQATLCNMRRHNNLQVASESRGEECCEDIERVPVPERPAPGSACQPLATL